MYAGAVASSFTASTTAVITGTKTVAAMYATGGFTAGTLMIIDNLSNAVNQFTHVFWSGGDIAKDKAQYVANQIGGKTLEMTRLGRYLESIKNSRDIPYRVWELASINFASQVQSNSTAHAILYYPAMREDAIWLVHEAQILAKKLVEIVKGWF